MVKVLRKYWLIVLIAIGVPFLLYPKPNQEFLYRNIPQLKGYTPNLIGSSTAVFLDPSFFYRFSMNEQDFMQLMQQLALEPVDTSRYDYFQDTVFALHGPYFWHTWWWQPVLNEQVWLFDGYRDGNNLTFLFVPGKQRVFLYIQNT
jgi:hypothetical protein